VQDDGRPDRPEEFDAPGTADRGEGRGDPDVFLDVPALNVEEIDLEVEDLRVRVSFQAELADLVKINVGLEAELGRVKLNIKGVQAQAQLKASLDNVREIFSEVLGSLDSNPRFFRDAADTTDRTTGTSRETTRDALGPAEPSEEDGAAADETDTPEAGEVEATDAARKKAEEIGLDLSTLEGTGTDGRIILRDVQRAARA
jgi:pyruvate/2-oxoglutarate dehydrogenase complex dihydrolipoamide acyltransferase (E2) component